MEKPDGNLKCIGSPHTLGRFMSTAEQWETACLVQSNPNPEGAVPPGQEKIWVDPKKELFD
jgi:hypothetical protein